MVKGPALYGAILFVVLGDINAQCDLERKSMKTSNTSIVNREKKTYTAPRLRNYGNVGTLTQTANSGSMEGSMGKNPSMAMSDRRLKQDIVKIGMHPAGFRVCLFNYKPEYRDTWGHGRQFGVMADEVEQAMPEAVSVHPDGYKMVDYALLGLSRSLH